MIIGRKEEIDTLRRAYESDRSEFIAVYGRRRIGKTFLIRETYGGKITFQYTGIENISSREQIREFYTAMLVQGLTQESKAPKNWFDAFHLLEKLIEDSKDKRKLIFIDEMPWMDTPNSRFLPAFEHFWNGWGSARKDVVLVICGSATSWIINKIFRNVGGLYNRVTHKILLKQFSLAECEALGHSRKMPLSRNMILEGYMVMGGVPYYWTQLVAEKSMAQNINDLFLKEDGELRNEFHYLYASMFKKPEKYMRVVEALSGKKGGLTRDELIAKSKLESNGSLSTILQDLIECGFIRKYCHLDKKLKDALYQLVDCYTLFYYQFVKNGYGIDEEYWVRLMRTPTYNTWCGLAFERVCLLHSRQIKSALGISGIMANLFSWHIKKTDEHPGAQIDLLIDRADNVVNVCEMKYAPRGYSMTATEMEKLNAKMRVLEIYLPRNRYIQPVLITSNEALRNKYSDAIQLKITSEQLFRE